MPASLDNLISRINVYSICKICLCKVNLLKKTIDYARRHF